MKRIDNLLFAVALMLFSNFWILALSGAFSSLHVPRWMADWGFWGMTFTGVIAIYAIRQFDETRRSNERQLRAYVSISKIDINFGDVGITVVMYLKNTGQTPIYDMSSHLWLTATNNKNLPLEYPADDPGPPSHVGPQDFALREQTLELPPDRIKLILKGEAWLFAYGHIAFVDAFRRKRRLDFKFIATEYAGKKWRMLPTREGNKSYDV